MIFKTLIARQITRLMETDLSAIRYYVFVFCLALVVAVYFLVMVTGGTKHSFVSAMYAPIVLAAMVGGTRLGGAIGIIGGAALGPYVPLDAITMELQLTWSWVFRLLMYFSSGVLIGLVSDGIRFYTAQTKWIAGHDSATQLPNRFSLERDIEKLKNESTKNETRYRLIISLENFREINNNCDSFAVPSLINQIAIRAQSITAKTANYYRLDDNSLTILLEKNSVDITQLCSSLRKRFQEPFTVMNFPLHCDIQLGGVQFKPTDFPAHAYIQQASIALSAALESNAPVVIHDMIYTDIKANEYFELLGNLKSAVDGDQLRMHFQPKVNLRDGKLEGVEALMRWKHPTLGDIPPGNFIPRAETSTLIDRLTEFAIDYSLAQVVIFRNRGFDIKVAVNISARNLLQPKFVSKVMNLLAKHGLDGSSLELEITENSLMQDAESSIRILNQLDKLGVSISIDDFGTGYSSLQYLHKLPVSILKIDQSFIKNLSNNEETFHIVETIIALAHRLNVLVIAEGVEDLAALHILRDMGCDMAQGYLIARPLSAQDYANWHLKSGGVYQI